MTETHELYRSDSGDTSRDAAESIDATKLEAMVLGDIRSAGTNGLTQDELILRHPDMSYSSITARPAALKRKKLIVDSGIRRKGRSGRNQAVLVASEFAISK